MSARRSVAASTVPDAMLTPRDVMALVAMRRSWVTKHAAELGAIRVGGQLRFKREDIDAYLERNRVRAADAAPVPEPVPAPRARPVLVHRSAMNPVTRREWGS